MKKVKIILFSFLVFCSSPAYSGCEGAYQSVISREAANASIMYLSIIGIPVAIRDSYIVHQARKMKELISEAKSRRIGKRTKGLLKSLNNLKTSKEIHRIVLKNNRAGKFCKLPTHRNIHEGPVVVLYRDFKSSLRFEIDQKLVKQGKRPVWNDLEDLKP